MTYIALFFAAGILTIQQIPALPDPSWAVLGCFVAALLIKLSYQKTAFFLLGMLWAVLYAAVALSDRLPAELESKIMAVEGRISGLPNRSDRRVRFTLSDIQGPTGVPKRLRLNWYNPDHEIKAGQRWAFSVKLKRPFGSLNPGGFDYEYWLLSDGIGATGYVRELPKPFLISDTPSILDISSWRQNLSEALEVSAASNQYLGIVKALAIGDKQLLSRDQWDILRKTGTVHLMAISGLHIGLIAGLAFWIVVKFWARTGILRFPPQNVAAIAALSIGTLYAGLAGFSVPTQRALIMLSVAMLSLFWQRNVRPLNTLAIALFTVLAVDPLAALSTGFWLSFLAVVVIIYLAVGRLRETKGWKMALKIHWTMAVALTPVLLFFFQQTSLIAPLANMIAVPVVSLLVVPIVLLAVLLLNVAPNLAQFFLMVVDVLLKALLVILTELASLPFAVVSSPKPSIIAVAFSLLGVFVLLMPRGLKGRWLGGLMFAPLLFPVIDKIEEGAVKTTLLDVGQGLATVVQTTNHVLIFDTGIRFDSGSDSATMVLLPFLRNQGIGRIDMLIVSHGDNDHIGGAESLLTIVGADQVLSSVPERLDHILPTNYCRAGHNWNWDGVQFKLLAPGWDTLFSSKNNNSCVLMVITKNGRILMTGDIESNAEAWLVKNYTSELSAEILIVPHHGSKTSSTQSFLKAVSPTHALIPSGYKNRFGFPHREVTERFDALAIDWLDTGRHGAITVELNDNAKKIEARRLTHRRYWHTIP